MAWVGVAVAVLGTALQYSAQKKAAKAAEEQARNEDIAADYEARQLEHQAGQVVAISQREALDERKKARLLESRALALAAASGGGASDPTIVKIMSDIAGEGAYRAQTALYEGAEESRRLMKGAEARRMGGTMAGQSALSMAKAREIASVGTLFSGAGSLYAKYGMGNQTNTSQSGGSLSGGVSSGSFLDAGTPMNSSYA